jgi:hypothetical protein
MRVEESEKEKAKEAVECGRGSKRASDLMLEMGWPVEFPKY